MKRLFLTILMGAMLLAAEDAKPQPGAVQRIFTLKYADANRVANLLRPLGIVVTAESQTNVLAVSGSQQTVSAVEEALKKLDVPSNPARDVELTGYLLLGSPQGSDAPGIPELASVIKQLRSLSPYKSYKLLESFMVRDRDGQQVTVDGFLTGFTAPDNWKPVYSFHASRVIVESSERPRMIRLDQVNLAIHPYFNVVAHMNTDVDIREGQKVVVGKANVNGSEDALFLVLSAKVVE
ncbi:MAG TPA: secretin N-terminal domain-containing protein [Bryobacteraceae bacterium]|nr:secretin N-terminal domain-containing protein [Bryobacteraceae bacterium]